jgi:hypothetical protein
MVPEISEGITARSALDADGVPLLVGRPWLAKLVKRTDPDASIIHRSLRSHRRGSTGLAFSRLHGS